MSVKVTVKDYTPQLIRKNQLAVKQAVQDCTDDLKNVAIGSAPHWKGRLEKGITTTFLNSSSYVEGKVGVSVIEKGYDYGQLRHDHPFNLGEKSRKKQGGKSGISGKSFSVGNGFISSPAEANRSAYLNHIEKIFIDEVCD